MSDMMTSQVPVVEVAPEANCRKCSGRGHVGFMVSQGGRPVEGFVPQLCKCVLKKAKVIVAKEHPVSSVVRVQIKQGTPK